MDRDEVRRKVDEILAASVIDRREWGESEEAQKAQDAFMNLGNS